MKKHAIDLFFTSVLIFTTILSCGKESTTEPESIIYNASGIWKFSFTQTKKVDGNYIECGTDPVPQRSFEILQDGNKASLADKNGEVADGSVSGASYIFEFREYEYVDEEDYIDFRLEINLTSDTSCTGNYRMDERSFFPGDITFYCITEGTLIGSTPQKSNNQIETGTVKDIDGNIYQTVKIGTQWWMAENLKVTRYRNGDEIPEVIPNTLWENSSNGGYCAYDDAGSNVDMYGLLYNWYAVNDSRGLAPQGWHVPSIEEWDILVDYLGGFSVAGGKMKEEGTLHWLEPNAGATNESGFTGRPGGYRWDSGRYMSLRMLARFHSSTAYDNTRAWGRYLYFEDARISYLQLDKNYGFSVRCVKD